MSETAKTSLPLVILRYPSERGDSYAVIRPSREDAEVYVIASSWFDTERKAKEELRRLRRKANV